MKAKLTMWGVKVWISADSRNAYISAFDIYTGDIFSEDLTIKTKGSYVLPPWTVRWYDNKDVFVMSTICGNEMTTLKRRRQESGTAQVDVGCPQMITDYNKYMGGLI